MVASDSSNKHADEHDPDVEVDRFGTDTSQRSGGGHPRNEEQRIAGQEEADEEPGLGEDDRDQEQVTTAAEQLLRI
ncbi:unannotated protein [freshwater metagenome]|uniref:Unannotated protein n=1 Tax=freshwater metagenome TaxID=449393 RepID=A0A6J7UBE3_9ZZZZ